jgi:uncharacterized surface protein with fasciclin (FAS1) repeats
LPPDDLSMLINYHLVFGLRFLYDFWYEQALDNQKPYTPGLTRYLTRCDPPEYTVIDELGRELIVRTQQKYINVYVEELLSRAGPEGPSYLGDYKKVYGKDLVDLAINASTVLNDSTKYDLNAENGALHAISEVVEPPRRIDELISESGTNLLFKEMMDKLTKLFTSGEVNAKKDSLYDIRFGSSGFGFAELANENDMYTVFIPPDDVLGPILGILEDGFGGNFDSIPNATLSILFLNHIVEGSKWEQDMVQGVSPIAYPGKTIEVLDMISSNTLASNGMVYEIDDVLMPDQLSSVAGPVLLNQNYLYFAKALERAGTLRSISNLDDETNIKTVLVVPNKAFTDAGIIYDPTRNGFKRDNKTMTSSEIKKIVENHVLRGSFDASDIEDRYYETENYLWLGARNGEFFGNETGNIASISITYDWPVNGYVHEVDKLLVAPDKSLRAILEADINYSAFTQALKENQLLDQFNVTISDGTYHTIFVPTNTAMDEFIADSAYGVTEMLQYHLVENFTQPLFTVGTENDFYETMLDGQEIEVEISGSNMLINQDALVIGTQNVLGISGVVQQIDKILYPPEEKK